MAKPSKSIRALGKSATAEPRWEDIGDALHVAFLDGTHDITVVMRSRSEWLGKGVEELRSLMPVARRTLGPVWLLSDGKWRSL